MHLPVDDDHIHRSFFPPPLDNIRATSEFTRIHMTGKRLLIGCVTVLIYDILITGGQSIAFSSRPPRSLAIVKVLFHVSRWTSFVNFTLCFFVVEFLNPRLCDLLSVIDKIMSFNLAIVEIILLLRLWVLYEHSRVVGLRLLALTVLGIMAIILVRILKPDAPIKCVVLPPPHITICPKPRPDELFYEYAIITTVHVISLFLVIWKSFRTWRSSISTPLVSKFVIDGVSYYLIVTTVFIVSMIAMTDKRIVWPFMESYIAICLSSIACNRLLLSLCNSSRSAVSVDPVQRIPLREFHSVAAGPSAANSDNR